MDHEELFFNIISPDSSLKPFGEADLLRVLWGPWIGEMGCSGIKATNSSHFDKLSDLKPFRSELMYGLILWFKPPNCLIDSDLHPLMMVCCVYLPPPCAVTQIGSLRAMIFSKLNQTFLALMFMTLQSPFPSRKGDCNVMNKGGSSWWLLKCSSHECPSVNKLHGWKHR